MGKLHETITPDLQSFIEAQHLFFVATAPLESAGHINLSPKGLNTFRVLSPTRVAYLDLTGSGTETAAHVTQNGRITFMFCAFEGNPMILRLYGKARPILLESPEGADFASRFPALPGARQLILADITRVQTSCGFAVPRMTFTTDRDTLTNWAESKGPDALRRYRQEKNRTSIDGLRTS